MGIPSLWAYQIIWWAAGVFMIWFLANKMDLSTLPKKPILNGDEYLSPDDVEEQGNYIDRMGGEGIIREWVRPMQNIDSIKVVDVNGLPGFSQGGC